MAARTLTGGKKLMAELERIARSMGGGSVSVGFQDGAVYSNGQSVASVAYRNEVGAPSNNQPPRPFFKTMIAEESPQWGAQMAQVARHTGMDGRRTMGIMGERIANSLQIAIQELFAPELSPVTLMLRKMVGNKPELITGAMVGEAAERVENGEQGATGTQAHPLIWTGHMANSISWNPNNEGDHYLPPI